MMPMMMRLLVHLCFTACILTAYPHPLALYLPRLLQAKKVLTLSEAQARNAVPIAYDASTPFAICAASLTPVPRGGEVVKSPYCGASYSPKYKGSVCVVDGMAAVGVETLGLVSMVSSSATQSKGK